MSRYVGFTGKINQKCPYFTFSEKKGSFRITEKRGKKAKLKYLEAHADFQQKLCPHWVGLRAKFRPY